MAKDDYDVVVFERCFDGGPNEMTLAEAKEAYAKGLPIR